MGGISASKVASAAALVVSCTTQLYLMQSEGGIFDSAKGFTFVGVDEDECRDIMAAVSERGAAWESWLALVVSKCRAENCFALGMGSGALFALYHLLARDVSHFATPVHLMQAVWAASVCLCNAQVAGLLPRPETSVGAAGEKITPFVFLTAAQAAVHALALLLNAFSTRQRTLRKKKNRSR